MALELSIVIPSLDGIKILQSNLPSVLASLSRFPGRWELIVCDDGSRDGTAEELPKLFPQVQIIRTERRLGFPSASNIGIREAQGEVVALLNNDLRVEEDFFLKALLRFGEEEVFCVAPRVIAMEEGSEVDESLYYPVMKMGKVEVHPMESATKSLEKRGISPEPWPLWSRLVDFGEGESFYASGAAMFVRRDDFLRLGGFDEIFSPYYWEDVDLGFRAWKTGLKTVYEPESTAHHDRFLTSGREGAEKRMSIYYRNQEIFFCKHVKDARDLFHHFALLPARIVKAVLTKNYPLARGYVSAFLHMSTRAGIRNSKV